ncbi:MAG TPA: DUF222 domain-containing protein [Pseudonocardiaceae bacterium]
MTDCQVIPGDLADIPPGPGLAEVLSGIDLARLSGFDCVEVLKARYRQLNHDRAHLMAAMVEVGLCGFPGPDDLPRMAVPDQFSADEIRAALVLTRRAADDQFWLAHDLVTRLPAAHAAMDAGRLDEPRARVLSDWTVDLTPEQARAVCDALLPRASTLTTGQLIEQIKKMAIAIDPDWARRRYEHAVADRKVVGYRNPDGSANLSGLNLPVDRVAAASGHIDALAKAAKRAGDPRPIDHIRADLFLGMTDGTYAGLDDAAILDQLRATQDDQGGPDDEGEPDNKPDDDRPDDDGSDSDGDGDGSDDRDEPNGGGVAEGGCSPADRKPRGAAGAGMELRVRLSTLLGHDEYPAELAGWGPIHAELARDLASTLACGQWRFAITDERGQLLHCGITRARPSGWPTHSARSRQIVELQIPATALRHLIENPDALDRWAPVVTDLAHQLRTEPRPPTGDPTRRFPGSALRRRVQIRDRYCVMIGCRAPARGADADHTVDHARSGATAEHNLGHACRHDHGLKHEGGWQLHQLEPGLFRWISRLGHAYQVRTPPIIEPLPDPMPGHPPTAPPFIRPENNWAESNIWDDIPPEPNTKPPPGPSPEPDSGPDPPPF